MDLEKLNHEVALTIPENNALVQATSLTQRGR